MLQARELKPLSQRAAKCDWCGMRGSSGSGQNLYWWQDSAGGKHLLHGSSSGAYRYGVMHMTVCQSAQARKYRERRSISSGMTFDELQTYLAGGSTDPFKGSSGYEPEPEPTSYEPEQTTEPVSIDLSELKSELEQYVDKKIEEREPTYVQIALNEFEQITLEHSVHYQFEEVWAWVEMTEPVWLTGPAGTGKSTIARHIAEAMGVEYRFISMTANTQLSEITGFMNAHGDYVRTPFRDAFEHGYVFCVDEVDRANPNTLLKLNEALASREFAFPDQVVAAHEKFRTVATANTYGTGADYQYVGGLQIDAASTDRFSMVTIKIDETLEQSVMFGLAGEKVTEAREWLVKIRSLRTAAESLRLKVVISPRASYKTAKALRNGKLSDQQIVAQAIRKGISDSDWDRLTDMAGVSF